MVLSFSPGGISLCVVLREEDSTNLKYGWWVVSLFLSLWLCSLPSISEQVLVGSRSFGCLPALWQRLLSHLHLHHPHCLIKTSVIPLPTQRLCWVSYPCPVLSLKAWQVTVISLYVALVVEPCEPGCRCWFQVFKNWLKIYIRSTSISTN